MKAIGFKVTNCLKKSFRKNFFPPRALKKVNKILYVVDVRSFIHDLHSSGSLLMFVKDNVHLKKKKMALRLG